MDIRGEVAHQKPLAIVGIAIAIAFILMYWLTPLAIKLIIYFLGG